AQQIAGGQWIGTGVFYQTPLYPYLLAVVFKLAGHSLDAVRVLQAGLGAAACALLGHAGRRFFDDRAGIIAALLLAFYPPAIFFDGLIQKSSLDIFLVTLVLALAAEFDTRRQWPWVAALGVAMGALVLNRENAAVWVPVISVWLLSLGSRARGVAWAALFVAAVFAGLLPVGIRNYRVGGEFVPSTSPLGPNFYIGNKPRAGGRAVLRRRPLSPSPGADRSAVLGRGSLHAVRSTARQHREGDHGTARAKDRACARARPRPRPRPRPRACRMPGHRHAYTDEGRSRPDLREPWRLLSPLGARGRGHPGAAPGGERRSRRPRGAP